MNHEVREHRFEDDSRIPNNPALPLLVYPQAFDKSKRDPSRCKALLARNGWGCAWVDGVFSYHHYHSNAHEVLCVVGGSERIAFGGLEGKTIEAGDVMIIMTIFSEPTGLSRIGYVVPDRPSRRQDDRRVSEREFGRAAIMVGSVRLVLPCILLRSPLMARRPRGPYQVLGEDWHGRG